VASLWQEEGKACKDRREKKKKKGREWASIAVIVSLGKFPHLGREKAGGVHETETALEK